MKVLLPLTLLAAAGATAWVLATRSEPTYVPPGEPPMAYAPAPRALFSEPGPGEALRVLDVEGMCCQGCTGKLYAALVDAPGVRAAAVDFESGTASVVAEDGTTPDFLASRLTFDKYTATPRATP